LNLAIRPALGNAAPQNNPGAGRSRTENQIAMLRRQAGVRDLKRVKDT
jgi:hypothetical protein